MGLYRSLIRPPLFTLPPETAHSLAGEAFRLPLPWGAIGGVPDDPRLAVDFAGIRLRNPIGLAAGFDKSARELRGLGSLGFGYLVAGTVSREPRKGNERPRVVRRAQDAALVNSMGIPNDGAEAVAARLLRLRRTAPVLVSLADEEPPDVLASHALLEPLCDGFELNVSSPNSPWRKGRDNEAHLRAVLAALMPRGEKPVFVKLPPYAGDAGRDEVLALASIAAQAGVDGLTCSNTRPVEEPGLAKGSGGLSGRPLFRDTPRIVEEIRRETGLPVNACGGISTPEDALACLDAGAKTVQLYTGLIFEGPRIVRRIAEGLLASLAPTEAPVQDG